MLSNMLPVTLPSFNPRTRVGCDTSPATIRCRSSAFQSTHPRGVRPRPALRPGAMSCFNPRTRVGCDCGCWCGPTASSRFNPRTRVGCDSKASARSRQSLSFNPRTRVGCDLTMGGDGAVATMFQSTHPRGVRLRDREGRQGIGLVSIHAPAWGATGPDIPHFLQWTCFNPRTRVGCDGEGL